MWIVRLALKQPHTIVVLTVLIFLLGTVAIVRTPTDIFPNIDIPVVSIIWSYNGLEPQDMADRIVSITERTLTTTVDDIQHIESQSLYGIAVVKVFFQPTASIFERQLSDFADILGRPEESCELSDLHANASIPGGYAAGS